MCVDDVVRLGERVILAEGLKIEFLALSDRESSLVQTFEWTCVEFFLKASTDKTTVFEVKCVFWPVD